MSTWLIILISILAGLLLVALFIYASYYINKLFHLKLEKYRQIYISRALDELNVNNYVFNSEINYINLIKILNKEIKDSRSSFKIRNSVINDGPRKRVQLKNIVIDKVRLDYNSIKDEIEDIKKTIYKSDLKTLMKI
ncbi:hypothetical protein [Spiroplasma turonicum]|uniref:Transmembrane protein n=1 Tax=Spiroplasma turonicum TaxID=216946 RepID=A0A0K1P666_9MOLU|nr:hypothetical protein [Spiroplasma turonicum]AKU79808.1 hypothetical protein STURON_00562 [Spiroplasma turonicum]ALX70826.1 hypothetical protein STURO_v1c05600 [Spiroplasma turonicum]